MHSNLVKFPKFYSFLMRLKPNINYEKLLYLNQVKRQQTIIDLGANIGYFTTLFSHLVGKLGEVHAFEPLPENYRRLKANTALYSGNVILNNIGVDQATGTKQIFYNSNDLEKASILGDHGSYEKSLEIEVISVDQYVRQNKMQNVDFVKCDVEGNEMNALKGMQETLNRFQPKLSIEVTLTVEERNLLLELLQKYGYENFQIIQKGYPDLKSNDLDKEEYFYLYASTTKNS